MLQADLGQVEAVGAPEPSEQLEVGAGAAPAVEDPRACTAVERLANRGRDERAEAAKPEMTRFGARGGAQQVVHGAHCIVSETAHCAQRSTSRQAL